MPGSDEACAVIKEQSYMKKCLWSCLAAWIGPALILGWLILPGPAWGGKKHEKRDAAEAFFAQTNIPSLVLDIPKASIADLRLTQWRKGNRPAVTATLREGTAVYTNVTLHLKGSAGSFETIERRPGFTLHMDKNGEGQTFHGLDKLSLNNSRQDSSYITDKLCREIFEQAGVPAPRATYARVFLNGRDLGLYVLTEGWDKTFLKRHFKNAKGNLYDGGFVKDIPALKDVNSGEHPEDTSDLKRLLSAAREGDLSKRQAALEKCLDLDRFMTMLALDGLMWNWDGYALNRNNYRLYHDLDQDKMVFLPHGMDQMFWTAEGPVMPGPKGIIARAVLDIPALRQRYLDRAAELLDTSLRVDKVTNRVMELAARVRPVLESLKVREESDNYSSEVETLLSRIQSRVTSVRQQLTDAKQLLKFDGNEVKSLASWDRRPAATPYQAGGKSSGTQLSLSAEGPEASKVWATTVWLEEGSYRLEARIKTKGVRPVRDPDQTASGDARLAGGIFRDFISMSQNPGGAGLRVWTQRKFTEGVAWDWFPYRESRNFRKRGLIPSTNVSKRVSGDSDWTQVVYDFDLKQPLADLHIIFDLLATQGSATLDSSSVTLRRLD